MPKYEVLKTCRIGDQLVQQNLRPDVNGNAVVELKEDADVKDALKRKYIKPVAKRKR